MCKRGLLAGLVFSMALLCVSCPPPLTQKPATEFVTSIADWRVQDDANSRGIVAVTFEYGQLVLAADMAGQSGQNANGEILLDLRYHPGLEGLVPLDLGASTIVVTLRVPSGFVGPSSAPNGVQIFVKDDQWRSCYSAWTNLTTGGKHIIRLEPGVSAKNTVTDGFDVSRVVLLGVKFGMNAGTSGTFAGNLRVDSVKVRPVIAMAGAPDLPAEAPEPTLGSARFELGADGFYLNGQQWFLVGANWQIIDYGQNFGATAWSPLGNGVSKHEGFVRTNLGYAARAGIKVIRAGLLDDGRAVLDADARVTGYSDLFADDVRAFLDMAQEAGCRIEFVLVDYQAAEKAQEDDGVLLRGRGALIRDAETRAAFVTDFLEPFLDEFGAHPALFGIDVINEPEWLVGNAEGGAWDDVTDLTVRDDTPVPAADLAAFIDACAAAIRSTAPGLFVTVGVSCPYAGLVQDRGLDYLAIHHYPWMGDFPAGLPAIPAGTPWMLEEYPTASTSVTPGQYLDGAVAAGSAGAFFWNLSPAIDAFTFTHAERDAFLAGLRQWVDE